MAFGDRIKAMVFTEYTADISKHERAIKKLSGEEKKRAKEAIDGMQDVNSAIDDQIAKYAAVGAAATAAFAVAKAGFEEYSKRAQLDAATVGVNLEGLQRATKGLVGETELLQFASSAMNGTFKLSQEQMEGALQGVLALRKQGKPLADTMERVGQAVREGNVEPLKELGLIIKGAENDTEAGLLAALNALGSEAKKMSGNFDIAGDDIKRTMTDVENAISTVKQAIGALVVAFSPLIKVVADLANEIARIAKAVKDFEALDMVRRGLDIIMPRNTAGGIERLAAANAAAQALQASEFSVSSRGASGAYEAPIAPGSMPQQQRGGRVGSRYDISGNVVPELAVGDSFLDREMRLATLGSDSLQGRDRVDAILEESQRVRESLSRNIAPVDMAAFNEMLAAYDLAGKRSILSAVFGTPAEIDSMTLALDALSSTMDSFVGAFGAGVDALITGSKSFGEAFKSAIAESSRALAVEFAMQALRHSLFAVGSLAFADFSGAARHGKAAAGYAAGAIGIGALARGLGAGQTAAAPPPTAGSAGVGASSGAGNGGTGGFTQVQLIDETFAELPPGQREAIYRRRARRAGITFEGDAVLNG